MLNAAEDRIKQVRIIILLLGVAIVSFGRERGKNVTIQEGWNGLATHVSTQCDVHPFIYSFKTGLANLVDDSVRDKIWKIDRNYS